MEMEDRSRMTGKSEYDNTKSILAKLTPHTSQSSRNREWIPKASETGYKTNM